MPMITGGHMMIYSKDPDADRSFMRDVLKLTHVDAGGGWLIFGMPPAEVAVHPSEKNDVHELFLMCADIESFITQMNAHKIKCDHVQEKSWGLLSYLTLPGGGKLGVYQPHHRRPDARASER